MFLRSSQNHAFCVFSGKRIIRLLEYQSKISFKLDLDCSVALTDKISVSSASSEQSSANRPHVTSEDETDNGKSFMKILNSNGPRTEP